MVKAEDAKQFKLQMAKPDLVFVTRANEKEMLSLAEGDHGAT